MSFRLSSAAECARPASAPSAKSHNAWLSSFLDPRRAAIPLKRLLL
jgi:hypothetical protein